MAALDCNCSVCRMTGFIHVIVPHEEFTLESGSDVLSSYRFGSGAAEHLFCSVCGVKSFYQPRSHPEAWSVNAQCLDQPVQLAVREFDGNNWEQAKARLDGGD
ncbi:MAG: GFA family protein [Sphingomicrobium sp.]